MSLTFACGHCGKTFPVDDKFAGKRDKCKECGALMLIPASGPAPKHAPVLKNRVEISPSRRAPSPPARELPPSRRAPAPDPTLVPDFHGLDEDLLTRSSVTELKESDFEPADASSPHPRSARSLDPGQKTKKKGSRGESPAFLIGQILLGLAIGSAGVYAATGMLTRALKTIVPNLRTPNEMEALIQERISLNQDLAAQLKAIQDVPAAEGVSAEVNQKLRAIAANLQKLKDARGPKLETDKLNQLYEGQLDQATNRLLQEFLRVASIPGIYNALNVVGSLRELARVEDSSVAQTPQGNGLPGPPLPPPSCPPGMSPGFNPPANPPGLPNNPGMRNRTSSHRGLGPRNGPGSAGPG